MTSDDALLVAFYYIVGMAWTFIGVGPGGWIRNDMAWFGTAIYVIFMGALWPLLMMRTVWVVVSRREEPRV